MKIAKILAPAFALCLLLVSCAGGSDELKSLCAEVGLNLSASRVVSDDDNHGGFHGDGVRLAVIRFDEAADAALLESAEGWHSLPLSDELSEMLYARMVGIYPSDARIPQVENGYWYFLDRSSDPAQPFTVRYSYNFTAALLDTDTNTLYYCKVDT